PEMVAQWYRDQGYQFLSFTDHNTFLTGERWVDAATNKGGKKAYDKLKRKFPGDWVRERTTADGRTEVRLKTFSEINARVGQPGKFLLIQGEEVSDKFGGLPLHMNTTNNKELLPPMGGESVYEVIQRNTDALIAQRERTGDPMIIHLNHPNFGYAVRAEDLMRVRGENFFEVYNGHPGVNNKGENLRAGTDRIWDIVLTKRIAELKLPVLYGLAVDDGHAYHDLPNRDANPGRGWVMVLATELSTPALISSLERGAFYSTSGVSLQQVRSSARGLEIDIAPEPGVRYTIEFIGTKKDYPRDSEPMLDDAGKEIWTTRRYSEEIGQTLARFEGTSAKYEFERDDLYVRARITSSRKHPNPSVPGEFERAWSQPVVGPAAPPAE
ncbi:MAG: hypothetical protein NT069_10110, partial [Planctomycetota bacterium]|nr:hypothetical protein [Planctomycetota bacterium]